MEDNNRLKLLVETKKRTNCCLSSWELLHQLYLSGVSTPHSLVWNH